MKPSLITLLVFAFFVSCGSKNTSGTSSSSPLTTSTYSTMSAQDEANLREDYLSRCNQMLTEYREDLIRELGPQRFAMMRSQLRNLDVQFSYQMLSGFNGEIVSSLQQGPVVTLYIGDERPELSWHRATRGVGRGNRANSINIMVMHDLLDLAGINDQGFQISRRIVRR